ncbi:GNAT family N-acetyltransferase [Teredinibacter turnerae]|uniref:GNAT family N-acetyltransferase n=1 Tax=Teredinibacter turnerae TaxID=2426 RepID=UPI001E41A596|nr:GNAT family N-acetyltransferase [Teredinibacter turnerae]
MMNKPDYTVREAFWNTDAQRLSAIRREVFIDEQQVPEELELDEKDGDGITRHFLIENEHEAIGCARLLPAGQIGRMAVRKPYRRGGYGSQLLRFIVRQALEEYGIAPFLHSQVSAISFYASLGFEAEGPEFDDAGIPHRTMRLPDTADALAAVYQDGVHRLRDAKHYTHHVANLARTASRTLDILCANLTPAVWANEEVLEGVSALARRSASSQIRLLIADSKPLQGVSHPLVRLVQRLPSTLQIRVINAEVSAPDHAYAIADRQRIAFLNDEASYNGFVNYRAPAECRHQLDEFDRFWNYNSSSDPNLMTIFI